MTVSFPEGTDPREVLKTLRPDVRASITFPSPLDNCSSR